MSTGVSTGASTGEPSQCGMSMSPSPWYRDKDGDSWGAGAPIMACAQPEGYVEQSGDCDDDAPGSNPGAVEACDQVDNDCDGIRDEFSEMNPSCGACGLAELAGAPFWFCSDAGSDWVKAREACMAFGSGVDLASVRSEAESQWIAGNLQLLGLEIVPDTTVWIGLRRIDELVPSCEISTAGWRWTDGTPFAYAAWTPDQPDNHPTAEGCDAACKNAGLLDAQCPRENCGDLIGNDGWNDVSCHLAGQGYLCRGMVK